MSDEDFPYAPLEPVACRVNNAGIWRLILATFDDKSQPQLHLYDSGNDAPTRIIDVTWDDIDQADDALLEPLMTSAPPAHADSPSATQVKCWSTSKIGRAFKRSHAESRKSPVVHAMRISQDHDTTVQIMSLKGSRSGEVMWEMHCCHNFPAQTLVDRSTQPRSFISASAAHRLLRDWMADPSAIIPARTTGDVLDLLPRPEHHRALLYSGDGALAF